MRSVGVSRAKCSCVSLACLVSGAACLRLFPRDEATVGSAFAVRRGFFVGVFCSAGRSVSGRLRLDGAEGDELSSDIGEEGIEDLRERVLYVWRSEVMVSSPVVAKEKDRFGA